MSNAGATNILRGVLNVGCVLTSVSALALHQQAVPQLPPACQRHLSHVAVSGVHCKAQPEDALNCLLAVGGRLRREDTPRDDTASIRPAWSPSSCL